MKQSLKRNQSRSSTRLTEKIVKELKQYSSKEKAEVCQRFFKTGKGEYGEGDVFIGVSVPNVRKLCKKYLKDLSLKDLDFFISNEIHEYRLFALLTLTYMYEQTRKIQKKEVRDQKQREIYKYYIKNKEYINNWDLVDLSAYKILGEYLKERDRSILYDLIESKSIWDKRIAILSTLAFIKEDDFKDILKITKRLLDDDHDLIQKALGWMLREVGKRDISVLKEFLDKYADKMPRTMLRYSIEKLTKEERKYYMSP
jgi:3-methyladenine DNA glycosylase AlkD